MTRCPSSRLAQVPWVGPGLAGRSATQRKEDDMLVLSRKLGEVIWIGEKIKITVVDIDRGKIRLGIEAPRDVPIYRQELLPLNREQDQQSEANPAPSTPTV